MEQLLDLIDCAERPKGPNWHREIAFSFRELDRRVSSKEINLIEKNLRKKHRLLHHLRLLRSTNFG